MENLKRRRYYIYYYKDFGNTYELYYAENLKEAQLAEEKGFSQIGRKEAERKCREEKDRRKHDPSFAYFASTTIMPIALIEKFEDCIEPEECGYHLNGYIYEK